MQSRFDPSMFQQSSPGLYGSQGGQGMQGMFGFNPSQMMSGLGGLFGGLFSDPSKPYDKAMQQYQKMMQQGGQGFNPFIQAGQGAINPFMQSLNKMQDPTAFMKNIMGQYQESPFAKLQQERSMQSLENMGSAQGLTGSSALQRQAQEDAQKISSSDMQDYFKNAMGVQGGYLSGLQNMMGLGMQGQGGLADMYKHFGGMMGDAAYGKEAGKQQKWPSIFGGLGNIFGSFF